VSAPKKTFAAIVGGSKESSKIGVIESLLNKADILILGGAKANGVSLLLPSDVVIADKLDPDANSKVVPASSIPDGWMGVDIGPDSIKTFCEYLDTAKTVIWNGPIGVFEFEKFAAGTEWGVITIFGGGDLAAAMEKVRPAAQPVVVPVWNFLKESHFPECLPLTKHESCKTGANIMFRVGVKKLFEGLC
ncbi:phosphoglycerate kinase, cytosolic, partial [Tanacetum coccineum]